MTHLKMLIKQRFESICLCFRVVVTSIFEHFFFGERIVALSVVAKKNLALRCILVGNPCNRLIVDMIATDTSREYPNLICQPIADFDCRLIDLAAGC